mmetsp:Transcript_13987/g.25850  ORF Transcript_13987/g.25850 Transcript_13987/m.25850 type:complete len:217 (-) Transcript_13987:102-752(-)
MGLTVSAPASVRNVPPPASLQTWFQVLKWALAVQFIAVILVLFLELTLQVRFGKFLVDIVPALLTCFCGVFLLTHDEHMSRVHQGLVRICCQGCSDQVEGGMRYMLTFCILNAVAIILQLAIGQIDEIRGAIRWWDFSPVVYKVLVKVYVVAILKIIILATEGVNAVISVQAYCTLRQVAPSDFASQQEPAGAAARELRPAAAATAQPLAPEEQSA